jgi:hypothetical protein
MGVSDCGKDPLVRDILLTICSVFYPYSILSLTDLLTTNVG